MVEPVYHPIFDEIFMQQNHSYPENKYEFGHLLLSLRNRAKLTQTELANLLNVTIRSIQNWEAGESYPKDTRLRGLIETFLRLGVFYPGREREEAGRLWEKA